MSDHTDEGVAQGLFSQRRTFYDGWKPIESAPKDGRHVLLADFTLGATGFGWYNGINVPWMAVAHYWSNPGEEGFYLSSGASAECDDAPLTWATHWMRLPEPL